MYITWCIFCFFLFTYFWSFCVFLGFWLAKIVFVWHFILYIHTPIRIYRTLAGFVVIFTQNIHSRHHRRWCRFVERANLSSLLGDKFTTVRLLVCVSIQWQPNLTSQPTIQPACCNPSIHILHTEMYTVHTCISKCNSLNITSLLASLKNPHHRLCRHHFHCYCCMLHVECMVACCMFVTTLSFCLMKMVLVGPGAKDEDSNDDDDDERDKVFASM